MIFDTAADQLKFIQRIFFSSDFFSFGFLTDFSFSYLEQAVDIASQDSLAALFSIKIKIQNQKLKCNIKMLWHTKITSSKMNTSQFQ